MEAFISGAGWITPHGAGLAEVGEAIAAGRPAPVKELPAPSGACFAATVPPSLVDTVARHPRLRRSSNISLFAAAAALAALEDAGIKPAKAGNCAVIFATSDGGVIYTRKFYDQVVREGAGSPLLFPETVYNAPGSHIAALLGLNGISYTLVGDATVGLSALELGAQVLASGQAERCLVVGAEEADWVLAEAYRQWRLAGRTGIQIGSNRGALIADGAAAVLLTTGPGPRIMLSGGVPFFRQTEAGPSLEAALRRLPRDAAPTLAISSANGTFVDHAEAAALQSLYGTIPTLFPKVTLGEPFGASALMQVVCALERLRHGAAGDHLVVPVLGLNHQGAAALISARR